MTLHHEITIPLVVHTCGGDVWSNYVKGYYLLVDTGETVGPAPKGGIYA